MGKSSAFSMEDLADSTLREKDPKKFNVHTEIAHREHLEKKTTGMRFDKGKLRLDLIPPELEESIAGMMEKGLRVDLVPPEAIEALAAVLTFGAKKYRPRNWEKGLKYRSTFASLRRHLLAWRKGERTDADSGLPTLYGALFGVAALITYEARGMDKELNDFLEDGDE